MWWDLLRGAPQDEYLELTEFYFHAMGEILQLPYLQAQGSALHGLGHLEHPGKPELIKNFLKQHPCLDEDYVEYAHAVIEGKVL